MESAAESHSVIILSQLWASALKASIEGGAVRLFHRVLVLSHLWSAPVLVLVLVHWKPALSASASALKSSIEGAAATRSAESRRVSSSQAQAGPSSSLAVSISYVAGRILTHACSRDPPVALTSAVCPFSFVEVQSSSQGLNFGEREDSGPCVQHSFSYVVIPVRLSWVHLLS